MHIGIFNEQDHSIEAFEKTLTKVLQSACQKEHIEEVEFNVIFVSQEMIQNLNRDYRKIDRVTDVITFALEDEDTVTTGCDARVLGDIYICFDKAVSQAEEYGHSLLREIVFLAVHGFYHLLGYDHDTIEKEKIMFAKQEEVLEENGITR